MTEVRFRLNEINYNDYFKILFSISIFVMLILEVPISASNKSSSENEYSYEPLKLFPDKIVPEWLRSFGGPSDESSFSVQPTSDGGYIIAGLITSFTSWDYDLWLIKTDEYGTEEWNRTFGTMGISESYSVQETSDKGFIIAGMKGAYNETYTTAFWLIKTNEIGIMEWNRTFSRDRIDIGKAVQQTSDGGYIILGNTMNYSYSSSDIWIIRTDSEGIEEWNMTYGGIGHDEGKSIKETDDGGFIITGKYSIDTSGGAGVLDVSTVLLLKINRTGGEEWNKTFRRFGNDEGNYVEQTSDAGFIIAGETASYGSAHTDAWLIKTNSTGEEDWNETFGGWYIDHIFSVNQTSDDGFIVAGETYSYSEYELDIWLIKTDENGSEEWNKSYGESWDIESARFACEAPDGGLIITGQISKDDINFNSDIFLMKTNSEGSGGQINIPPKCIITSFKNSEDGWITVNGKSSTTYGSIERVEARLNDTDWFLINGTYSWTFRLNTNSIEDGNYTLYFRSYNGQLYSKEKSVVINVNNVFREGEFNLPEIVQWKTYGNIDEEFLYSLQPTDDGGYIIGGGRGSFSWLNYQWFYEPWVLKINSELNEQWNRTYVERYWRHIWLTNNVWVNQTFDGGFVILEHTWSEFKSNDILLIKTDENGNEEWNKTFGGKDVECAKVVSQTRDGGYIILGWTMSIGSGNLDIWVIKTDSSGNEIWNHTYGAFNHDYGYSLQQTTDGGFIITGQTNDYESNEERIWLIKLDSLGEIEWDQIFGFWSRNTGHSVMETSDGGFIISGRMQNMWEKTETCLIKTDSNFDSIIELVVLKFDSFGNIQWNFTFDGIYHDEGLIVIEKPDGNLLIAGRTTEYGPGDLDIILIELKPGDPVPVTHKPKLDNGTGSPGEENPEKDADDKFKSNLVWFILAIIIIVILIIITLYLKGRSKPSEPLDPRQHIHHPRT
jgi:hypothetical protein